MNLEQLTAHLAANLRKEAGLRHLGLENEYPLVTTSGEAISPPVLEHLWLGMEATGWELQRDPRTGTIKGARREQEMEAFAHDFDYVTLDLGYSTLEICLAPMQNLHDAVIEHRNIVELVTGLLAEKDALMLGYGVQPVTPPDFDYITPGGRYRNLVNDWHSRQLQDNTASLAALAFSAARQTHVDVTAEEAIPVVNSLSATAALRIALGANSPVWQTRHEGERAMREHFWDRAWTFRRSQTGIPPRFRDLAHYLDYLLDFRAFMVERDDGLYLLSNHYPFRHFLFSDTPIHAVNEAGEMQAITPRPEDIRLQFGYAWFDARLQPVYSTVEDRCCCQQPPESHHAMTALAAGLIENSAALTEMANRYSRDQWRDMRLLACQHGMNFSYQDVNLPGLLREYVSIARHGLEQRGLGEEVFLEPLEARIETGKCPADDALAAFESGGIPALLAAADMRRLLHDV